MEALPAAAAGFAAVGLAGCLVARRPSALTRSIIASSLVVATALVYAWRRRARRNLNEVECTQESKFLRAALDGDVAACEALLSAADPLSLLAARTDDAGWTALHLAAGSGHSNLLRCLLGCLDPTHAEAFIEAMDGNGCTPLLLALCNQHADTAKLLIANGADCAQKGPRGRNALHLACLANQPEVVAAVRAAMPPAMFEEQARAHTVSGYTALHACGLSGATVIADTLLSCGWVAVDAPALDGTTALHAACRLGHADTVELLLSKGARQVACRFGNTPLHVACAFAQPEVVRTLVQRVPMAELVAQDNDGMHPLHVLCQALGQAGVDSKPGADRDARLLQCFRLLVEYGYPLDALDYGNCSILYLLCWKPTEAHFRAIDYLLGRLEAAGRHGEVSYLLGLVAESGWTCLHGKPLFYSFFLCDPYTSLTCQSPIICLVLPRMPSSTDFARHPATALICSRSTSLPHAAQATHCTFPAAVSTTASPRPCEEIFCGASTPLMAWPPICAACQPLAPRAWLWFVARAYPLAPVFVIFVVVGGYTQTNAFRRCSPARILLSTQRISTL